MVFGGLTFINPKWLQDLGRSGRHVEATSYKSRADDMLQEGEYATAIALYREALKIEPDRTALRMNMAHAWIKSGNDAKGTQILKEILQSETKRSEREFIYLNLADAAARQGNTDEAIAYYQQSAGETVSRGEIYFKIGLLHLEHERYEDARAALEMAVASETDLTLTYRAALQQSLDIFEDEPEHVAAIEQLLSKELRPEDLARYDLDTIRGMQVGNTELAKTHNHLALALSRLGEIDLAAEQLEKVLAILPDNEGARKNLDILNSMRKEQQYATAGQ